MSNHSEYCKECGQNLMALDCSQKMCSVCCDSSYCPRHGGCDSESCEDDAEFSCEGECGNFCDQCLINCSECSTSFCENCLPKMYPWVKGDICKECYVNLTEAADDWEDMDEEHHPEGYA